MRRIIFLGSLVVMAIGWWGCSGRSFLLRNPAWDSGVVGPDGEVIIFYKENNKIVIKECASFMDENFKAVNSRSDCNQKEGTKAHRTSVEGFRRSLEVALKLPGGHYSNEMKRKIELYNRRDSTDVQNQLEERERLKSQIANLEEFIQWAGEGNEGDGTSADLRDQLRKVENALGDNAQLEQIVGEINSKITELIQEVTDSSKLTFYTYSTGKSSFVFNILRAAVKRASLVAEFAWIEKGSFTMGSPREEEGRNWGNSDQSDEEQVVVTISKGFWMMKKEVTQLQWFEVMGWNRSRFETSEYCSNHRVIDGIELCPDHPVENVSWNEVRVYIEKLNEREGRTDCHGTPRDGSGCYRLPTEAEWEFAVRKGTETRYSFGDSDDLLDDYAWYFVTTRIEKLIPWVNCEQTPTVFLMCTEMSGSGFKISTQESYQGVLTHCTALPGLTALSVAVVGTTTLGTCAPRIGTAAIRASGTPAWGSAL